MKKKPEFTANMETLVTKMQRIRDQWGFFMRKWKWLVTDSGWQVTTLYHGSLDDMQENVGSSPSTLATSSPNWEYLNATINVNLRKLADISLEEVEEEIEYWVVHELVHCLLSGVARDPDAPNALMVEQAVTNTARGLVKASKFNSQRKK